MANETGIRRPNRIFTSQINWIAFESHLNRNGIAKTFTFRRPGASALFLFAVDQDVKDSLIKKTFTGLLIWFLFIRWSPDLVMQADCILASCKHTTRLVPPWMLAIQRHPISSKLWNPKYSKVCVFQLIQKSIGISKLKSSPNSKLHPHNVKSELFSWDY